MSVDESGIKNYIKNELNVDIIDCVIISKSDSEAKSFKVTVNVNANECEKLLHGEIWPMNIRVRKYYKVLQ